MLFKNIRGTFQIQTLGLQLFPGKSRSLTEALEDATNTPFGYLMIDLTPRGQDEYRLRTKYIIVYKRL